MLTHTSYSTPILIDFYAPWCGPCKLMKMELKRIKNKLDVLGSGVGVGACVGDGDGDATNEDDDSTAAAIRDDDTIAIDEENEDEDTTTTTTDCSTNMKTNGGIPIYHVNANKFPQVGAKNNIHGLPTLVLFHEGKEVWRNEGFICGEEILKVLKEKIS